jgi:glycosyltransferase involved in cell wall biosynthesis
MNIAIAISVHNRHETAAKTVSEWRKRLPKGAKLFVVDDGSDTPFEGADFRFEVSQGIAGCKNKCLHLCEDADYIFLADDDIYPIVDDWYLPYINSGEKHLCLTFNKFSNGKPNGRIIIKTENGINHYKEPCGVLLFLTREVLQAVGGMDQTYGKWGFEHLNYSVRIYNLGFTKYPFMDVVNSIDMFYSYDHQQTITRSVDPKIRAQLARVNERKYRQEIKSKAFIPYKAQKNLVLTCYFTTLIDPQRGTKWDFNPNALNDLKHSIPNNTDFRALVDTKAIRMGGVLEVYSLPKHENPYMAKWIAFRDYIVAHPEYDNIALLDGTDTEILNNPFPHIDREKLYCGDEPGTLNNQWLRNHHPQYIEFLNKNMRTPILNAGVIIGHRMLLLEFLDKIIERIPLDHSMTDMTLYNYTLRTHFNDKIVSGRKVTTVFKAFDKVNRLGSWIKHK